MPPTAAAARPCGDLPYHELDSPQLNCALQHRACRSMLQPSLGVSSLDLGRPPGRPLFAPAVIARHLSCGSEAMAATGSRSVACDGSSASGPNGICCSGGGSC